MVSKTARERNPLIDIGLIKERVSKIIMLDEDCLNLIMPIENRNSNYTIEQNWYGFKVDKNVDGKLISEHQQGFCQDTQYVDELMETTKSFITMEVFSMPKTLTTYEYQLSLNAICHRDLIPMTKKELKEIAVDENGNQIYHGNRIDAICQAVYKALMKHSRDFGIGDIDLDFTMKQGTVFQPNGYFYGKNHIYRIDDFAIVKDHKDI